MAQKRVEGYNFDARKQLLDYDDVLRRQREIIYEERNKVLESQEVHGMVHTIFENTLNATVDANLTDKKSVDCTSLEKSLEMMGLQDNRAVHASELENKKVDEVKAYLLDKVWKAMKMRFILSKTNSILLKRLLYCVILTVTGSTILI